MFPHLFLEPRYVTDPFAFVTLDGSFFLGCFVLILGRWVACWMLFSAILSVTKAKGSVTCPRKRDQSYLRGRGKGLKKTCRCVSVSGRHFVEFRWR